MPQRSNRSELIEGTLRCLERLPAEQITARVIAQESGANLASITYHFGSKDKLVTAAVIEGLDRWLAEISAALAEVAPRPVATRFQRATRAVESTRRRHAGLARSYVTALARAQHDDEVRALLATGFQRSRPELATVLGLGDDQEGRDAAGLVLALFHGLLLQSLLDPTLAIEGNRMSRAQARLREHLPS
jgi:AcrR family transcriptional regulator